MCSIPSHAPWSPLAFVNAPEVSNLMQAPLLPDKPRPCFPTSNLSPWICPKLASLVLNWRCHRDLKVNGSMINLPRQMPFLFTILFLYRRVPWCTSCTLVGMANAAALNTWRRKLQSYCMQQKNMMYCGSFRVPATKFLVFGLKKQITIWTKYMKTMS